MQRQGDNEPRAQTFATGFIDHVFGRQCAAMGFDDLSADGQAKPGILPEGLTFRAVCVKTPENMVNILRTDARAIVFDVNQAIFPVGAETKRNAAVRRRDK